MPLPQPLETAAQDALKYIDLHPQHEYHPEKRKELIGLLMSLEDTGVKTRAVMSVAVGKRVLPLFEAYVTSNPETFNLFMHPEEHKSMGQEMMRIAEDIVLGRLARIEGENALYNRFYFMIDPIYDVLPFQVASALHTCYKALNDIAYRCIPGDKQRIDPYTHYLEIYDADGQRLTGERLTDHTWQQRDTYGQGLITFAYDFDSKHVDANKSQKFWHWWLTEALPQAWEFASQTGINHQDNST